MNRLSGFEDLVLRATDQVRRNGLTEHRISQYGIVWRGLKRYLEKNEYAQFNQRIGQSYLNTYSLPRKIPAMSAYEKIRVRAVFILVDYQMYGTVRVKRPRQIEECPTEYLKELSDFLDFLKYHGLSATSLACYTPYARRMFKWFECKGVNHLEVVRADILLDFVKHNGIGINDCAGYSYRYRIVKHYLHYLERSKHCNIDHLISVLQYKPMRHHHVPDVYSMVEIERIGAAIDTSSSIGKRDYAIFMLTSQLGIRASDVVNLRFGDIDWMQSTIRFCQVKTKAPIELPLMPQIESALIDYLLHGRPALEDNHVFLTDTPPVRPICARSLNTRFRLHFRNAGVNKDELRRYGPHILRHSLASSMLKAKVGLPVIQASLGHISPDSTMQYVRIDIDMLRKCALPVLPASGHFAKSLWGVKSV